MTTKTVGYGFDNNPRYIRAYTQDNGGNRCAVAFFDKRQGLWFEAESWSRPRCRISSLASALAEACRQAFIIQEAQP